MPTSIYQADLLVVVAHAWRLLRLLARGLPPLPSRTKKICRCVECVAVKLAGPQRFACHLHAPQKKLPLAHAPIFNPRVALIRTIHKTTCVGRGVGRQPAVRGLWFSTVCSALPCFTLRPFCCEGNELNPLCAERNRGGSEVSWSMIGIGSEGKLCLQHAVAQHKHSLRAVVPNTPPIPRGPTLSYPCI